jgi:hypothetical protein
MRPPLMAASTLAPTLREELTVKSGVWRVPGDWEQVMPLSASASSCRVASGHHLNRQEARSTRTS